MPDWKAIARARGLDIPDEALENIAPTLEALDQAFRPLANRLTWETEPAVPVE